MREAEKLWEQAESEVRMFLEQNPDLSSHQ